MVFLYLVVVVFIAVLIVKMVYQWRASDGFVARPRIRPRRNFKRLIRSRGKPRNWPRYRPDRDMFNGLIPGARQPDFAQSSWQRQGDYLTDYNDADDEAVDFNAAAYFFKREYPSAYIPPKARMIAKPKQIKKPRDKTVSLPGITRFENVVSAKPSAPKQPSREALKVMVELTVKQQLDQLLRSRQVEQEELHKPIQESEVEEEAVTKDNLVAKTPPAEELPEPAPVTIRDKKSTDSKTYSIILRNGDGGYLLFDFKNVQGRFIRKLDTSKGRFRLVKVTRDRDLIFYIESVAFPGYFLKVETNPIVREGFTDDYNIDCTDCTADIDDSSRNFALALDRMQDFNRVAFKFRIDKALNGKSHWVSISPLKSNFTNYFLTSVGDELAVREKVKDASFYDSASFHLGIPYGYLYKIFW